MHEGRFLAAIASLETEVISKFQGARLLNASELAVHGKQFKAGWELPGLIKSDKHRLRLLLPDGFPFARSRVAIDPAVPVLTWPHLEERGLLCTAPEEDPHSPEDPVRYVVRAVERAQTLVNDSLDGRGYKQFEDEFVSYWNHWAKSEKLVRSLCRPDGPSRWVSAWYGKEFTAIAEDDDKLRAWLNGYFGAEVTNENFSPLRMPYIWLEKVPRPAEYPENVSGLLSLVKTDAQSRSLVEDLLLDQGAKNKSVLFGCRTRGGVGLGAVCIAKPQRHRGGGDPLTKGGFRGTPPKQILLARYAAVPVIGANVVRCDPAWVHGRDHNPDIGLLMSKSVVILGVGSVGSHVATLLAKSGVGKITLVDPQPLESENISRHELGVNSVKAAKATQLAASLQQRFPHLMIKAEGKAWQEVARVNLEQLTSANLVISTMGNWCLESELNAFVLDLPSFPPVLYGWTEPHATAGHAVVFMDRTSCLRCLTNDLGELRTPVTSWKHDTMRPVPACGGSFQPYGAVELDHINSIITELALDVLMGRVQTSLHRIWIGRRMVLERAGGEWNPEWVQAHTDPGDGGNIVEVPIVHDPQCPACKRKT